MMNPQNVVGNILGQRKHRKLRVRKTNTCNNCGIEIVDGDNVCTPCHDNYRAERLRKRWLEEGDE